MNSRKGQFELRFRKSRQMFSPVQGKKSANSSKKQEVVDSANDGESLADTSGYQISLIFTKKPLLSPWSFVVLTCHCIKQN